MPDRRSSKQVIALALTFSAVVLAVMAALVYTGIVPLPEETRAAGAVVIGVVAFGDFLIGLWFFRMGQSS